jgi:lipopolysaccharide transport protein LptA
VSRLAVPFVALAAILALAPAARGQASGGRAEVTADRLTIDQKAHTARFEGNVVARYGDLAIECSEMTARYGESGSIASLEAKGRVTVRRGDATAEAGSARLDAAARTLVLEGSPTVTRGAQRLSGKRIAVHLDSGAIEVLEARGTFSLPLEGAR